VIVPPDITLTDLGCDLALATGGAAAVAGLFGPLVDHAGYNPLFLVTGLSFPISAAVLPRAAQVAHAVKSATTVLA
jgi:hypothetical protein